MTDNYYFLAILSVLGGLSFAAMTYFYEKGRLWNVSPPIIALGVGITGTLVYGVKYLFDSCEFSFMAMSLGFTAGLAQGVAIWLIKTARRRGPFTPISASLNLAFIPPVIYSIFFLKENVNILQAGGLLFSLACVVAGSIAAGGETNTEKSLAQSTCMRLKVEYFLLLVVMVICVGVSGLAIKYMSVKKMGDSDVFSVYRYLYFLSLYIGLFLPVVPALFSTGTKPRFHKAIILGVGSGIASCLGMFLTGFAARLPAGIGFATVCIAAIAGGGVVCAYFFGEQRNIAWYMNLIFAIVAVICFNIKI